MWFAIAAAVLLVLAIDPHAVDLSQKISAAATVVGLVATGTAVLLRWGLHAASRRSSTFEMLAVGAAGGACRALRRRN